MEQLQKKEAGDVTLLLAVLRRPDCIPESHKAAVRDAGERFREKAGPVPQRLRFKKMPGTRRGREAGAGA